MAYWMVRKSATGSTCVTEFIMDNDDELSNLPTMTTEGVNQGDEVSHKIVDKGSIVFSIESSSSFMLNSSNTWVAYTGGGGGGSVPSNIIRIKKFQKSGNTYTWADSTPAISNYVLPVYVDENDVIHYPSLYSDDDAYYSYMDSDGTTLTSLHFSFSSTNPTLVKSKEINLLEVVM